MPAEPGFALDGLSAWEGKEYLSILKQYSEALICQLHFNLMCTQILKQG